MTQDPRNPSSPNVVAPPLGHCVALPADTERPNIGFYSTHALDQAFKANLARLTAGITPAGLASAYFEWWIHLTLSPGKQLELGEKFVRKMTRYG